MDQTALFRSSAAHVRGEREKNVLLASCLNSLKSLDSDERIQGNPRKSKSHKRGPSRRDGMVQENPKRIDQIQSRPAAEGARPTPSKCNAPQAIAAQMDEFGYCINPAAAKAIP